MSARPQFYVLDADGNPVPATMPAWAEFFATTDRTVARELVGAVEISTVFLGLDRAFGVGPPLLYGTMIFGGVLDGSAMSYSTRDDALSGHRAAVKLARDLAVHGGA